MAEEAHQRAVGAQTNPVAGLQHQLLDHGSLVDQGALAAAVAQQVGAPLVDDLAVPAADGRVEVAVEDEVAVGVAAEEERRTAEGVILIAELEPRRAGVSFSGNGLEIAYRVCLWSRVANRVLLGWPGQVIRASFVPSPPPIAGARAGRLIGRATFSLAGQEVVVDVRTRRPLPTPSLLHRLV